MVLQCLTSGWVPGPKQTLRSHGVGLVMKERQPGGITGCKRDKLAISHIVHPTGVCLPMEGSFRQKSVDQTAADVCDLQSSASECKTDNTYLHLFSKMESEMAFLQLGILHLWSLVPLNKCWCEPKLTTTTLIVSKGIRACMKCIECSCRAATWVAKGTVASLICFCLLHL